MTATLEASAAIIKTRYPKGELPKACYANTKHQAMMNRRTDWTGGNRVVALQNEYPQGLSAQFAIGQGSVAQGTYNAFSVPRVEYFGFARIKGQALKAAEGDEGALCDLWKNEMDGIARQFSLDLEIFSWGTGNGVLGRIASGEGTATITLSEPTTAARFALGMRVQVVSSTTLSPTVRGGGATATITGIDRKAGTLTIAGVWNTTITSAATNDYIVRAGNAANAGTARVPFGKAAWVVGGTSPGTLCGLNRDTDPVRLSGQAFDCINLPLEECTQEMIALVSQQGIKPGKTLWCHTRDAANFRKSQGTKVTFPRTKVDSKIAGVGFSGVEIEGDETTVTLLTSPFMDRYSAFYGDDDTVTYDSTGPAPQIQDFDGPKFLRVAGDDAHEARWVLYGNQHMNNPGAWVVGSNFGR